MLHCPLGRARKHVENCIRRNNPKLVDCDYEVNVPRQTVELDGYELSFRVPNEITQWRIEHLVAVEPITIAWILGFVFEDILVDIGAGIGVFTVNTASSVPTYSGLRI